MKALILPALLLTGCAALGPSPAQKGRDEALRYAAAGEAVTCLPIRSLRETRVLDDHTIDFVTVGGERYRNTLPVSCPGLSVNDGISYSTSLTRLCSVDIVTVLQRGGGGLLPGASCGLGPFQPVERTAAP